MSKQTMPPEHLPWKVLLEDGAPAFLLEIKMDYTAPPLNPKRRLFAAVKTNNHSTA
jgi:hypothetical protein